MAKFDSYFLMKAEDAAEYVKTKLDIFNSEADIEYTEIGDGNLNYIFQIRERKSGKSVVIKQAGDTARISDQFKVSPDRNRIEYNKLRLENNLVPGLVPKVFHFDKIMNCTVMEDLSDHVIMRSALVKHEKLPLFADHITTFMANTLLLTSDAVMNHKEKKGVLGSYINPDLCEITEDLVYTEPFNDINKRNDVFPPNMEFVKKELYSDSNLLLETAKMKFDFLCNAQSLIHGDLHTGSIFVKPASTKVIDPEFAFYGPAGYDVGNIIANLIFAWANADTTMNDEYARKNYTAWLEQTIVDVMRMFKEKWMKLWNERVTEVVAHYNGFADWYLGTILRDTAGVAGLELCRRIVGIAHVLDMTSIENEEERIRAERLCLSAAKRYIFEREHITTGKEYLDILRWAASRFPRI
jgi:5-methylthioribose kinase